MVSSSQSTYSENDDATLICTSFGGPENSFQWFKDGVPITELVTGENNTNVLVIYNVTASTDGGVYECVVNNSAGSDNANVSLNISPQFSQSPQDVLTRVGETVTMVCVAVAYPQPTYQWVKLNGDLPTNATGNNSTTLIIHSVTYEDEGSYCCIATANRESVKATAVLIGELMLILVCCTPCPCCFHNTCCFQSNFTAIHTYLFQCHQKVVLQFHLTMLLLMATRLDSY